MRLVVSGYHDRRCLYVRFDADAEIRHAGLVGQAQRRVRPPHLGFHRLQTRIPCERLGEQRFGSQIERRGFIFLRDRRRRVVRFQAKRRLELSQHRIAGVFEIRDLRGESILFDLRPQHVLQCNLADLVLGARELLNFAHQPEHFLIHPDLTFEKMEFVIGFFENERCSQHARLKREIFRLALRGRDVGRRPKFTRARQLHHEPRHQRHHHARDIRRETQLWIGQRPIHRDALHGSRPIVVSRLDLRLVQDGELQKLAESAFSPQRGQRRTLMLRPVNFAHRFQILSRSAFTRSGNARAARE